MFEQSSTGSEQVRVAATRRLLLALSVVALLGASAEFPEYPDDPSAFTTVIEVPQYDDRFETVADLLDHVAGVRVRRYGGLGSFSTASIRGAKSERVLVLLDGIRLNSAHRGAVDLSTLPVRMIERIEVVRGGGAARHGSDAVGGVISLTTRRTESVTGADLSLLTGDLDTLGADVLLSPRRGRLSGVLGYSRLRSENDFRFGRSLDQLGGLPLGAALGASLPEERHTRLNADFLEETGLASLEIETGPDTQLLGTVHLHRSDRGQPGGVPADVGLSDEEVSCPHATDRYRRGVLRLAWTDRSLGPGSFEASLFHRFERSTLKDPGGSCRLVVPALHGGRDEVGATELESGLDLRFARRPMDLGPFVLRGRSAATVRLDQWRGDEADDTGRLVANLFAQEDVAMFGGRLRLVPAIGLELAHTRETEVRDPTQNGALVDVQPDDDAEWLPRIGAILQVAPGLQAKANFGRSYRRPSFRELFLPDQGLIRGNPHLKAEESWSFDVGLQAMRRRIGPVRDLRAEAVYFHRDLTNPIEFVQVNSWTFAPRNLDASRVRGVELSGSLSVTRGLELAASYTHMDAEIRSTGTPLPHRPRNRLFASAALNLSPTRYWLEFTQEDEVPLTETGNITADPAHQLDVGVTLQLADLPGLGRVGRGITLSAEWINVTDEERVDSLGLPLPGRIWYLRLRGTTH